MIRKIGKIVATFIGGIIPALMLMLVMSSIAWALSSGTGVALKNGQIGLVNDAGGIATDLPTAASTLLGGTAIGEIFYSNAADTVTKLAPGTAGEVLKLATSGSGRSSFLDRERCCNANRRWRVYQSLLSVKRHT